MKTTVSLCVVCLFAWCWFVRVFVCSCVWLVGLGWLVVDVIVCEVCGLFVGLFVFEMKFVFVRRVFVCLCVSL